MISSIVRVESCCEPATTPPILAPNSIQLICSNTNLNRPLCNGTPKYSGLLPINGEAAAVIIYLAVLVETIIKHPVHNLVNLGTLQNTMFCSPVNYHRIRNEYLGLITRLRKGFLSGDTVAVPLYAWV